MSLSFRAGGLPLGMAAALSACAAAGERPGTTPPAEGAKALGAQHWDLAEWTGQTLPEGSRLRLDFDPAKGRFSSSTTCNRIFGAYKVDGRTLRFGNDKGGIAATMMACPEPGMSMEGAYSAALSSVTGYSLDGGQLVLTTANGATLTYRAVHKPAADAPRKFIYVSAETRPCTGVAPMTCLQIREKESDPWQLFYGSIVDFEPQPGIEYRLRIIEETVANPPADASSIRWTLDQVIEQRVVSP